MASAKPAGYKLATYKSSDGPRAGLIVGDEVFDAAKLTGKPAYATVIGILADWKSAEGALKKAAAGGGEEPGQAAAAEEDQIAGAGPVSLGDLLRRRQLCRPCRGDGGARGQSAAARSAQQGLSPGTSSKRRGTIADPGATVKISHYAKAMDWEIELAAVIGRPAKDVPQGEGAQLCRRLYGRPTTFRRATAAAAPGVRADLAVQDGLDQAQDLRGLVPDRAVDRAGERHRRSAKSRA